MQRRKLVENIALGAAGALALGQGVRAQTDGNTADFETTTPETMRAQPAIAWRMATSWPKPGGITFQSVVAFCDRVKTMTNGQFVITPHEAGEITPALKVFDAVQADEIECGHTSSLYYLDRHSALVFGTTLPFGLTPYQQYAWFYYGGGRAAMETLYKPFNVLAFPAGTAGIQMGGWTNKEINTVADLAGLKMRITGFGAKVLERLGVETVALGGDEIYDALASGQVEAAEWQNPHADEQLRLHEVAKYYYYPGWWEPGSTYKLLINQSQWAQLPKAYQSILKAAAAEANLTTLASFDAASGAALQRLSDQGTELKAYSPEILEAARKITFDLLEETAREDAEFKVLYDQWVQFRRQIFQWNQVNELSFEQFSLTR